jgi:type I restriction enzyme R subunit
MKFNEDARVKIPSILHLKHLECRYLSLKDTNSDIGTNIFTRNRKVLPTINCLFVDEK